MKFLGIELKKIEKTKLRMRDKLALIETVSNVSNGIIYVELILRVMILKEIGKVELDIEEEVLDVYEKYNLDNIKNILKYVNYEEYKNMLRLSEERFKELQMMIDPDAIEYLQKRVTNNDKKSQ